MTMLSESNKTDHFTKTFFSYAESVHKEVSNLLEYFVGYMLGDNVRCHMVLTSIRERKLWFHPVEISVLTKKIAFRPAYRLAKIRI